jgi:hypothetical protein
VTPEYVILFDVRDQPFHVLLSGLSLLVGSIAALGIGWWTDQRGFKYFAYFAAIVFALATAAWLGLGWLSYAKLQRAMRDGDHLRVEGIVENFRSDVESRGGPQSFSVENVRFSFYRADSTPAFHRTVLAGGPNLAGQCVSIAYTENNDILWLAIKPSGCGETPRPT